MKQKLVGVIVGDRDGSVGFQGFELPAVTGGQGSDAFDGCLVLGRGQGEELGGAMKTPPTVPVSEFISVFRFIRDDIRQTPRGLYRGRDEWGRWFDFDTAMCVGIFYTTLTFRPMPVGILYIRSLVIKGGG